MIKWLKRKYNRWLFKKYGFDTDLFFERIPLFYKVNPLWSPSLYTCCEGAQIRDWFLQGLREGEHQKDHETKRRENGKEN